MLSRLMPFLREASITTAGLPADGMRSEEFERMLQRALGHEYSLLWNALLKHWAIYHNYPRYPHPVYVFFDYTTNERLPLTAIAIHDVKAIIDYNTKGAKYISQKQIQKQHDAKDRELKSIRDYLRRILPDIVYKQRKKPVKVAFG